MRGAAGADAWVGPAPSTTSMSSTAHRLAELRKSYERAELTRTPRAPTR